MSDRDGIRLFVAVDPPQAVRDELAGWARGAARIGAGRQGRDSLRVLEARLLHVTVWFLGERPPWEIDLIAQAVESTTGGCGELSLGAPTWLPPQRPRALAVQVHDPAADLARLRGELTGALGERLGLAPEGRRLRPHVTVARMSARASVTRSRLPPTPRMSFLPQALVLYRSLLAREGASYEALTRRALED